MQKQVSWLQESWKEDVKDINSNEIDVLTKLAMDLESGKISQEDYSDGIEDVLKASMELRGDARKWYIGNMVIGCDALWKPSRVSPRNYFA